MDKKTIYPALVKSADFVRKTCKALLRWSVDRTEETDAQDIKAAMKNVREDASNVLKSMEQAEATKSEEQLYAFLCFVKDTVLWYYNFLALYDQAERTDYVKGVRV